jgi:hypothetical protein
MTAEYTTSSIGAEPAGATDYVGAIYGSLLAASVVLGASIGGAPRPFELAVLLLATGLVFWVAHAYARATGDPQRPAGNRWANIRAAGAREWPLFAAALPPAAAATICGVLGVDSLVAAWLTLAVAIGHQVAWAVLSARRVGATVRAAIGAGIVNLVLGLIIVALKVALQH